MKVYVVTANDGAEIGVFDTLEAAEKAKANNPGSYKWIYENRDEVRYEKRRKRKKKEDKSC